jgi:trehalose 6-phosphate phosphatase
VTLPAPPPPAPRWALFLDFDGTLAPLRQHPDDVRVDDATRYALRGAVQRLDGAVCVVSGRPLRELRRLLGGIERIALVGCHGGEGLDDPAAPTCEPAATAAVRKALAPVAGRFDGVWFEDKPVGFAIHYRRFPHAGPTLLQAARDAIAGRPELRVVAGHAVVEVLPATVSKGVVLERLLTRTPFRGRVPVAVGDDVTDEDAFAAATRAGGFGVLVGARTPSVARYAFADAGAVGEWLRTGGPADATG